MGRRLFEVEGGEVIYWITGFLAAAEDAVTFVEWFNARPLSHVGIEGVAEVYGVFVGEHGWAPAAGYRQMPLEDARAGESAPVHLEAVAAQYPFRGGPRDQSVSDNAWLRLPVPKIVQIGDLRWNGQAADFLDSGGNVAAFDPSAHSLGPSALLVREE